MSAFPDDPVTAFLEHRAPPHWVIERARQTAMKSPCAKSKRGAAIFYPDEEGARIRALGIDAGAVDKERVFGNVANTIVIGDGFNGPPEPMACDASTLCKRDCKYLCLHAEERAIVEAAALDDLDYLELVHVKVVDGVVVPGGGPSCWQCSRKVLEHKLAGVWLYEQHPLKNHIARLYNREEPTPHNAPEWVFYTAIEFHKATLKACELGEFARPGTDTR